MYQNLKNVLREELWLPALLILVGAALLVMTLVADLIGLSAQGFGPNQVSMGLVGLILFLAGIIIALPGEREQISVWLLLVTGAGAIAFAADLFVIGGLPGVGSKQLVLATVFIATVLISLFPARQYDLGQLQTTLKAKLFDRVNVLKFGSIIVQFGLLVLVIRQFQLENQAFYEGIMLLAFYGFIVHFFLPLVYRLPFFVFLSLVAILGVLGITNGILLIGAGLVLIGLCHVPVRFSIRVALLLGVGIVLALLRSQLLQSAWPDILWPILGSMFMFRLIIYMYDLRHLKEPVSFWRSLAYFFMLPNIVFLFFPVVDFASFRRTYFNEDRYRIYQRGLTWMFHGVLQLVLYRFVNNYIVIPTEEVASATDVARFATSNFLLYLRVSGQFTLIVGLLHLFGFNLTPVFNSYLLSSSFTDLWRRINIYWKDFMQKIFYYPAYFRLTGLGDTSRLIVVTLFIFFMTWFLHAYQWFWLRGSFLFTATDILFWSLLAILFLANILFEAKRGRKRTLGKQSLSYRDLIGKALRPALIFSVISFLWSLWTSETVADWLALWSVAVNLEGLLTLFLIFLGITVIMGVFIWTGRDRPSSKLKQPGNEFRPAIINAALLGLILVVTTPSVYAGFGNQAVSVIDTLKFNGLTARDAELLQRGYYEDLIGVDRFNTALWDVYSKRPSDWPLIQETAAAQLTNDFRAIELLPSQRITFHGATFSTNSFGMRDKEYTLTAPEGIHRIVLLGPSYVMGSGVADNEVFEWLLEDRLNDENATNNGRQIEILNMAVAGYSALQELYILETEVLDFEPETVFYVAHQLEETIIARNLADFLDVGIAIPYPYLEEIIARAGIVEGMSQSEMERLLKPFGREILRWSYERMVADMREEGILPVWVFIPALELPYTDEEVNSLVQLAEESGFIVLDLSDVYDDHDEASIIVAEWDKHPNALGHQLIAEDLYSALMENEQRIPLILSEENEIR